MNIKSLSCVFFSPTGSTKAIVENIAQGFEPENLNIMDITKRSAREQAPMDLEDHLLLLAIPVYYGRVPQEILTYLNTLKAQKIPVALVAVYGNRNIDDALMELKDIAESRQYLPIAASIFVAEHSYSTAEYPIASNRPDQNDMAKAQEFGQAIREKIQAMDSLDSLSSLKIPGGNPYVEPMELNRIKEARAEVDLTPQCDLNRCTHCGKCVELCPTAAISSQDVAQTDKNECIICFACVKKCPMDSRQMKDPNFNAAIQSMSNYCQDRNEPRWFL